MLKIRELPKTERPAYRAEHYGMGALASAELIQLVTSFTYIETAAEVRSLAGSLSNLLNMSIEELTEIKNVGKAAAIAIKAAMELGRRLSIERDDDQFQIRSPADAANLVMMEMSSLEQEHLRVILLDTKNHVIEVVTVYIGNVNTSVLRVGELYKQAIRRNAVSIIVVHNHPSGDPNPSPEDAHVTKRIVEAGEMMDIAVIDHLIIGKGRFVSMKERKLGFN